ncbi:flagellar hook basal-body protein [Stratiformator vulcanicus]|uniref:Flagellar basal-body rod protein FlgG n=1 Tax=Stratiformator vulcanicus TaxID=2527980 RepID=A0A517QZK0_9PLAN|nr:flagellar hook basal-body protein [Stratiformator vulcanicus]QDT37072.1 Flagellar basal-body rod protein FlgG [Stratiformator vulcanicus]
MHRRLMAAQVGIGCSFFCVFGLSQIALGQLAEKGVDPGTAFLQVAASPTVEQVEGHFLRVRMRTSRPVEAQRPEDSSGRTEQLPTRYLQTQRNFQTQRAQRPNAWVRAAVRVAGSKKDGPEFFEAPLRRSADAADDLFDDSPVPEPLPVPENASPVPESAYIRDLIDLALPHAGHDEREIWEEQLEDLAPNAAMDLLEIRRRLGSPTKSFGPLLPQTEPSTAQLFEVSLPSHSDEVAWVSDSIRHLKAAERQILSNIANASTPGYTRREAVLGPADPMRNSAGGMTEQTTQGVEQFGLRFDLSDGSLRKTGRVFDLAVEGAGFLVVANGKQMAVTKSASFVRDNEGRLVLDGNFREWELQHPIVVPAASFDLRIGQDGSVMCRLPDSRQPTALGRITIVRFVDPSHLEPLGPLLWEPTVASGDPVPASDDDADFGTIRSGFLTESNVDLDAEVEALDQIRRQIELLERSEPRSSLVDRAPAPPSRSAMSDPTDSQFPIR